MSDLRSTLQVIQKDLHLAEGAVNRDPLDEQALKTYLTEVIRQLLDQNFERLLRAMYRMDVAEQDFKSALQAENPDTIPATIANLIIAREKEKVETRKKYTS